MTETSAFRKAFDRQVAACARREYVRAHIGEALDAMAAVERVTALHKRGTFHADGREYPICIHCSGPGDYGEQFWPCATVQALDGK